MEAVWTAAVCLLDGDQEVAAAAAADLVARYAESHRRYHGPGDDERRSASWARDWLARAGVGEAPVARAGELVLATTATLASTALRVA